MAGDDRLGAVVATPAAVRVCTCAMAGVEIEGGAVARLLAVRLRITTIAGLASAGADVVTDTGNSALVCAMTGDEMTGAAVAIEVVVSA